MSKETIISSSELNTLKSHGTVYICRSCKDNKNQIVLLNYKAGGIHQVFTGFCSYCESLFAGCGTCRQKTKE
jgi:hypothetical protein